MLKLWLEIQNKEVLKLEQESRTKNSIRNSSIGMMAQITAILMGFITRVVFTHTLSQGYVGINGLFTDILNILSLTELGVGTAITYALYGPIAKKDEQRQKAIMHVFRNLYRITAAVVFLIGICIIPFLNVLMKNRPDVDHIVFIYLLYLMNTVVSYLLIYKKTLIDAYQKSYITILYHNGFIVLQDIFQIAILLLTKNFILYLSIAILCTFIGNVCMSKTADKMFPFLKDECHEKLNDVEKEDIVRNIKATFINKLSYVIVSNTDNLLISSFVGVISSGIYSNYYLLIASVRQAVEQALNGVSASVGNLGKTESAEKKEEVYLLLFFLSQWIYGFCAICLFELLNLFIEIVFGKQYLFSTDIVLILCINFFLTGLRRPTNIFKESMGLFWYDRKKAVIEAFINLVASLILVQKFGIAGIFLGTFLSTVTVSLWYEPYVIYKYGFHKKCLSFFGYFLMYIVIAILTSVATYFVGNLYQGGLFLTFLYRVLICVCIPNGIFFLLYHKSKKYKILKNSLLNTIFHKKVG